MFSSLHTPTSTLLLLLLTTLLTTLTLSAPAPAPDPNKPSSSHHDATLQVIPVSAELGVFYCTAPNWSGGCGWTPAQHRECINIRNPSGTAFSLGPDRGLVCSVFSGVGCGGDFEEGGVRYPGTADFGKLVTQREMPVARSYRCEYRA